MNYQFLDEKYLLDTYPRRGVTFLRGKGVYLYDDKGRKYLDMMSNYGVNIFGHGYLELSKALKNQLSRLTNLHCGFSNDKRSLASQALIKRCGENFAKVYWGNSGAEAIEAALKFAAFATGKKKFVAAKNSFHGKTLGALSAMGKKEYRQPFEPLLWNFVHAEFGSPKAVREVIDNKTAAVILEPIQGEAGIILPPINYLKEVREICDKNNILLILDEVKTGLGRTGTFLASEDFGVEVDILCLGKALGGGIPVGATLVTEEISRKLTKGLHTSTFGGNPLASAGALATLNLIDKKLLSHVRNLGLYFLKQLGQIKSNQITEVRGKGLMIALELQSKNTPFLKALQEKKILAIPAGNNVVRFLPPFIIEKEHIDEVTAALKEIL